MVLIQSHKELKDFFTLLKSTDKIGFDIETTGLNFIDDSILSIQANLGSLNFVFTNPDLFEYICSLISNKLIIGHNLKFDMKFIYKKYNILFTNVYDTMIAHTILNAGLSKQYVSLNSLVEKYFGITLDKEIRKEFENADELSDEMVEYAAKDVEYLIEIREKQIQEAKEKKLLNIFDLEMKLLPVVTTMETIGITLDTREWLELSESKLPIMLDYENKIKTILVSHAMSKLTYNNLYELLEKLEIKTKTKREKKLLETILPDSPQFVKKLFEKINIGSPKQLLTLLNLYGLDINSTSDKALNAYEISNKISDREKEIIEYIRKFRENSKRVNAFGKKYLDKYLMSDGKIHAEFNQMGAATGRFSSSNPNLQQVPHTQDYRKCFVASPGYKLITADYSQMELRIMAVIANEINMLEPYNSGADLHKQTASIIFNKPQEEITKDERYIGKRINFAIIYGAGAYRIANILEISTDEAEEIYNRLHEGYKNLYSFVDYAKKIILDKMYSVTLLGRKRFFSLPEIFEDYRDKRKKIGAIEREGVNHIVQGTGADIVKLAMVKMFYENPWGIEKFRILLQIHDEVVVEVSEDIAEEAHEFVKNVLSQTECNILKNKVPCDVESHLENYWVK